MGAIPPQGFSKVEVVKKASQSGRMKRIEKQLYSGETRYGLYYTMYREQRRARAAHDQDAIALRGVPAGGGWARGAWEML